MHLIIPFKTNFLKKMKPKVKSRKLRGIKHITPYIRFYSGIRYKMTEQLIMKKLVQQMEEDENLKNDWCDEQT